MTESDDFGGDGLYGNTALSEGGDVGIDRSDETGGGVCSCEHSRGLRTEEQSGVSEFSVDSQRFTDRAGNSFIDSDKDKLSNRSENGNFAKSARLLTALRKALAQ